jgi:hypothetical protein
MTDLPDQYAMLVRFGHKVRLRRMEWLCGAVCFIAGFILLAPGAIFDNGPAYAFIRTLISEEVLGVITIFAGALRLAGLIINGARRRVTPWMRLFGAVLGAGIFTALSLGFLASGVIGLWMIGVPVYATVEYLNIWDTTRDARQAHG